MSQVIPGKKKQKTVKSDIRDTFKDPKAPDDFEDELAFLSYAVKLFDDDLAHDEENRKQAVEDAKFMVGEQWDDDILARRKGSKKPTMVFNRLPAFVAQIVGNRRLTETQIKIVADDNKFKKTATLREGLVRSIQKISKADIAYDKALENQVITGLGNFEVCLEYASDDVFEQDIKIKPINNPFSVVWDRHSQDPTGRDAKHVFVVDTIDRETFNTEYPDAKAGDLNPDTQALGYDLGNLWLTDKDVRVVSFWRMRTKKRTLALLRDKDGSEDVVDVTDMPPKEFVEQVVSNPDGIPVMREADVSYAQLYIFTALDLLEGPYDLPITRVPLFRVPGWDINVGESRVRFGLIRFLKDPQRYHNFWRSTIAEKLMKAPKGNWVATATAVAGREKMWQESHLTDDELLIYDGDEGPAPTRIPPVQIEPALIEQANTASQDLKDISNMHEANLGQKSNEVSGKAIIARQRVGETGTVIYQDNLELAIEECGRLCNELIPHVYDTTRTIKIVGLEGEDLPAVIINGEAQQDSEHTIDITAGKYTVSSTTGPSTATKRVEAAEGMLNMVNAMPDRMGLAADMIIIAQDWPGNEEIARRVRLGLPPGVVKFEDMTEEEQKTAKLKQEAAQKEEEKQNVILGVELREKTAKAEHSEALAIKARAEATQALANIDIDTFKALSDVEDTEFQKILSAVAIFERTVAPENKT